MDALFHALPRNGSLALRDPTLLLFLYNTGARVQEVADVRLTDVDLTEPYRVRLHGKGDKWRCCPIWPETVELLKQLVDARSGEKTAPVFQSHQRKPMTRFGIYKIVKRQTASLKCSALGDRPGGLFPHAFRHSAAVHLLEAGRRRCQCYTRVARPCQPGHHESLRGNHLASQAGRSSRMCATSRSLGGMPLKRRMAQRRGSAEMAGILVRIMFHYPTRPP
jgi:integrase